MGRPREFDQVEVLRQAMLLFWRKGYEATSMADLLEVTGLSKSSLYDTFGDKRRLFLAALEAYRRERLENLRAKLNDGRPGRVSIAAFFAGHALRSEGREGCMSCNEAVELAPRDGEVQRLVNADFAGLENAFAEAITRGQADGSVTSREDPRKLARFLAVSLQGLNVMDRAGSDAERLVDSVAVMLSVLDAPPAQVGASREG